MRRAPCLLLACGLLAAAFPAFARQPAILDLAALPPLAPDGRAFYAQRFLLGNLPRAFAVASNGAFGGRWAGLALDDMRAAALEGCAQAGGTDCAIYAEDLDVVWKGRRPDSRPAPPGPLFGDARHAFVPDPRFFWHGPEAARGVVVWAHGFTGADHRGTQPPPYVRAFNNAGFDVVRFDRDPAWDALRDMVADWLREGLAALRRRGWRTVVSAGQSRGAWNNLQALDAPGLADVVVAVSPAADGLDAGGQIMLGNTALWAMASNARAPTTRVAFVQFEGDAYYTDPDRRVAAIDRLRDRVAAVLVIDRPAGITGHGGADTGPFAERFGPCLLRFATAPRPPQAC